jgi:hypothetical protein
MSGSDLRRSNSIIDQGKLKLDAPYEVLTALAGTDLPFPTRPLPETAKAISGKTMRIDSNPTGVTSLRLDINGPAEAIPSIKYQNGDENWKIGLDGKFHLSSTGIGVRGYWVDPQTFLVEILDVGPATYRFKLDGNRVEISSPERGLRFSG